MDEVEQEGNSNLLDLPQNLPDGVYFLLTRRPYTQNKKRLFVNTPYEELNLKDEKSQKDIKEYLHLFMEMSRDKIRQWIQQLIKNSNQAKNQKEIIELKEWIQRQNPAITQIDFIDKLAEKSQNNFMYLRYVLPAIATGKYNNLSLKGLSQGLEEYYITHWQRMGMENDDNDINVKILFILVARGGKVSSNMIADILDKDILPMENILAQWLEYVTPEKVKEERKEKTYYSIYHRSFLEFLQNNQRYIEAKIKGNLKRFRKKLLNIWK
ncbi:transcriptional regulator [Nostoc sp.]|uniref:transcriptional regulator n=1 Tax=Nostoc sp. TaxID=1180 RepID=UPI002FFBCF82